MEKIRLTEVYLRSSSISSGSLATSIEVGAYLNLTKIVSFRYPKIPLKFQHVIKLRLADSGSHIKIQTQNSICSSCGRTGKGSDSENH